MYVLAETMIEKSHSHERRPDLELSKARTEADKDVLKSRKDPTGIEQTFDITFGRSEATEGISLMQITICRQ